MNSTIELKKLSSQDADFTEATHLYVTAFPVIERREVCDWIGCINHDNHEPFTLLGIYKDNHFYGFITSWEFENFVYLEHFAINESARGHGIGALTLAAVKNIYKDFPLVLEVEPPCTEMATRRIGFYSRQGFVLDESKYMQPPYRKGDEWFELKLMSTQPDYLIAQRKKVEHDIYTNVYRVE